MVKLIIFLLTVYGLWAICGHFGIFEANLGISQVDEEINIEKRAKRSRSAERKKLNIYKEVTGYLSFLMFPEGVREKHKFIIERLEIRSEVLDRFYTPEELRGKHLLFLILGIMCIPVGVFFPICWIGSVLGIFDFIGYQKFLMQRINDEDEIIDTYFLDLYLLMYSRLRMGSKARLQTVVESYIETLKVSSNVEMRDIMLKFSRFFLNNLSMYEDHVAVQHLRDRYRSATIVNFCNIGAQALQGIDNADTLLTFKMDLVRKKTDVMKKNAEILYQKGNRSIYLIYVILFIFIAVGWYSKLPTSFF